MLMDGLYEITDLQYKDDDVTATIILNLTHDIFKGHYPGQPVLPGACMLQIIKDTLELALTEKLILKQASQMKFLAMIGPRENRQLTISLTATRAENEYKVAGSLMADDKTCFKFQGSFYTL